ncbi:hypothetical protein [Streptomyces sp. NPDC050534]|uniref:hypothetical protein n=1 Tax=Streptomyces sp. NPDC050534 TaxID=3365625 RepID=UPI0037910A13
MDSQVVTVAISDGCEVFDTGIERGSQQFHQGLLAGRTHPFAFRGVDFPPGSQGFRERLVHRYLKNLSRMERILRKLHRTAHQAVGVWKPRKVACGDGSREYLRLGGSVVIDRLGETDHFQPAKCGVVLRGR